MHSLHRRWNSRRLVDQLELVKLLHVRQVMPIISGVSAITISDLDTKLHAQATTVLCQGGHIAAAVWRGVQPLLVTAIYIRPILNKEASNLDVAMGRRYV
jgi:hypothetical protein